jgi:hypothetical protein
MTIVLVVDDEAIDPTRHQVTLRGDSGARNGSVDRSGCQRLGAIQRP